MHDIEPWHLPHMGNAANETARSYPRTMRQAFPHLFAESAIGITGPVVIPTKPPLWVRVLRKLDAWLLGR